MTCKRCERTQEEYVEDFEREHRDAQDEFVRLTRLFKDVCWYNFETKCRQWDEPWRRSNPNTTVELEGQRYDAYCHRGHMHYVSSFPIYYRGLVGDAPSLPPQIVLHELKAAHIHLEFCKEQVTAPYDWAPGGVKYEMLHQSTMVGRKRRFSSVEVDGRGVE